MVVSGSMNAKQPTPDVCLVLEGTYPFVQGGVSSWVHNLIRGLPETSFTLLHLGASPLDRYDMKYSLPSNVVGLQQLFVQGSVDLASTRRRKASGHDWPSIGTIPVRPDPTQPVAAYLEALFEVLARDEEHRIGQQDPLATSGWSWDLLTRLYERLAPHLSFTDFYWTWRYTH